MEDRNDSISTKNSSFCSVTIVNIAQKLIAEIFGMFVIIVIGCGSVVVNKMYGAVTFLGICITWGLVVMVMVYSLGHISGAHFNPAVTLTFAALGRFPLKQVYFRATLGSWVLFLLLSPGPEHFYGTTPIASDRQSLFLEIIISFLLMFVISAIRELAGIVVGSAVLIAEAVGTFFIIFIGCGSIVGNKIYTTVTFPGICIAWGLVVMAMIYTVGHISGAHFNPAITITFTALRTFPVKEAPLYIVAQLVGATFGSGVLYLLLNPKPEQFYGTIPVGSDIQSFVPISGASMNPARSIGPAIVMHNYKALWAYIFGPVIGMLAGGFTYKLIKFTDKPSQDPEQFYGTIPVGSVIQSFVLEIIISFLLMFVISGAFADTRAIGELGGIAIGATILLSCLTAGPISGASMNPARSIGPAIIMHNYKALWAYIFGPVIGMLAGGFTYKLIKFSDKPSHDVTKNSTFLKNI
ncbi:putative aquaporin NIP-type [Ananas comosus]|uniref:Putative aquaporin NIP-type n=1 Tax=Ananas comosus TaxID=4615 RepID=A0A199UL08_ANACO|nr:putative aquaporin NIP-type [Ananas comosus]